MGDIEGGLLLELRVRVDIIKLAGRGQMIYVRFESNIKIQYSQILRELVCTTVQHGL